MPECRQRFGRLMAEDANVRNAQERKTEFEEREVEKRRRKEEKKEEKKRRREEKEEDQEEEVQGRISRGGASSSTGVKRERDEGEEMEVSHIEVNI